MAKQRTCRCWPDAGFTERLTFSVPGPRPQIVHEPRELAMLLEANAPTVSDFDAAEWLNTPGNLALRIGFDLAMFDFVRAGVYGGHVWFSSRGAKALEIARIMLDWMFTRGGARVIIGETPETQRRAWLFVRKLGFKRVGMAERKEGRVILSCLRGDLLTPSPVLEQVHSAR